MRRWRWILCSAMMLAVLGPATSAQADVRLPLTPADRDGPLERGFVLGLSASPGAFWIGPRVIPTTRLTVDLGAALSERWTLMTEVGATTYLGRRKASFTLDVVAARFFGRGFFLRAGPGVQSRVPTSAHGFGAGVGTIAGAGYEFRVAERGAIALGVDYEARWFGEQLPAQGVVIGLRIRGYPK